MFDFLRKIIANRVYGWILTINEKTFKINDIRSVHIEYNYEGFVRIEVNDDKPSKFKTLATLTIEHDNEIKFKKG